MRRGARWITSARQVHRGWWAVVERTWRAAIQVRHQKAVLGLPRKGKPRICERNEIRKCLKESLSQLEPISVQRVAVKLGYCNAGCLRREFPDLCRAIGKKLQKLKGNRQRWREREFVRILKESPLPTATRVCQRLGYRMPSTLFFNFPREYEALLAGRRAQKARAREDTRLQIERLSLEEPPISVPEVARRDGFSDGYLYDHYPDLCHAIAAKRRQYWKAFVAERTKRLRQAAFAAVSELDRKGIYPTLSDVLASAFAIKT